MDIADIALRTEAAPSEDPRSIKVQGSTWSGLLHFAEWTVTALLLVTLVKGSFMQGWSSLRNEFPDYYLAAALPRHGIPLDRVYEWPWFQRQNDRLGVSDGLVSFAPNPPSSVLPLVPLTALSPLPAKRVWLVLNLVFLGASLWLLSRVTSLGWRRLLLISLLCVVPLHFTFMFGRYYVLILLLFTAAYYASYHGAEWNSGLLLSAAAVLKLFPALFVILIVWKRNWRALAGFLVGTALFVGISLIVFGVEVHRVFVVEILSQRSVRIDHTEKLQAYQSMSSVQAYLIVHQQQERVEYHTRDTDDTWQAPVILSASDTVRLPCIDVDLSIAALYA